MALESKRAYLGRLTIKDTKSPNKKFISYRVNDNKYSGYFHVEDITDGKLEVAVIVDNDERKGLALVKTISRGFFEKKDDGILVRPRDLNLK